MRVVIWDWPVRLFHWSLAISASIGLYSGFENKFDSAEALGMKLGADWGTVHLYCGYTVLSLCIFRLFWGLFGSSNVKLWRLAPPFGAVLSYMKTLHKPAKRMAGHNPMGSYASLVLIFGFLAQAAMGLYAMDDYFYEGPLAYSVSSSDSKEITSFHKLWGVYLIAFVSIHISTIILYRLVRKRNLVTAMVTGHDELSKGELPPTIAGIGAVIASTALTAAVVWYWVG